MLVTGKKLVEVFGKRKDDDPRGAEESHKEKELEQQNASMGELIHAPILTQPGRRTSGCNASRCYPKRAWALFDFRNW